MEQRSTISALQHKVNNCALVPTTELRAHSLNEIHSVVQFYQRKQKEKDLLLLSSKLVLKSSKLISVNEDHWVFSRSLSRKSASVVQISRTVNRKSIYHFFACWCTMIMPLGKGLCLKTLQSRLPSKHLFSVNCVFTGQSFSASGIILQNTSLSASTQRISSNTPYGPRAALNYLGSYLVTVLIAMLSEYL